jgi:hypothetical protein
MAEKVENGKIEVDVVDASEMVIAAEISNVELKKTDFCNGNYVYTVKGEKEAVWRFIKKFYDPSFRRNEFNAWWKSE